jgi:hypothetical protein
MNFAYLDTRSLIESIITPPSPHEHIEAIPYSLDQKWLSFEKELSNFKNEFAKARIEYRQKHDELCEKKEELAVFKMISENINSPSLKNKLIDIADSFESEEGISALTQQCREEAGKIEAMKKVLYDTNSERYAKFTCFVCMDKLVELFIDPCGHVICERCWVQTRDKSKCPGCRTPMHGSKKIFTI